MRISRQWLEDEDGSLYNLDTVTSIVVREQLITSRRMAYIILLEHTNCTSSALCNIYDTKEEAEVALDDLRMKIIS